MAEEPVYAPDQLKPPPHVKAFKIAGVVCAILLILMIWGNHHGHVEDIFLVLTAALILIGISLDTILRRSGLKR